MTSSSDTDFNLGQYHWVALLTPSRTSTLASWFTGWISCGGQVVLNASAAFAAGLEMQALITANHPDSYLPQRWQGMLFYWLVLIYAMVVNLWGSKILPHTNIVSGMVVFVIFYLFLLYFHLLMSIGVIHIVALIAIVVVLGVMAEKNDAYFVFAQVTNTSGWESDGVSWLVGLLSTVYPFLG